MTDQLAPQRYSHSYCPHCDIAFPTAAQCPKCYSSSLIHPPKGSTAPKQTGGIGRRPIIGHDNTPPPRWSS